MAKPAKIIPLIILGVLFLSIAIPRLKFPDLDHGDEFADSDVLNSGENFVKFGFIKCRFLPMFQPHLDKPQQLYTHYPALPNIINGILRMAFKTDSLRFFRGVSLFFAFLGLIFWYLFTRRLTGSYLIALVAAIFYLYNPFFIYSMDSLHLSYADALRSVILFVFLLMINPDGRKKRLFLILAWTLLLIESWLTIEYIIYLSLFFILYRIFFKESRAYFSIKDICIFLSAPVCGFLLHFLQNAWYFGSFALAFKDLRDIAVVRVLNSTDAPAGHMHFLTWLKLTILRNFSLVLMFNYFVILVSLFFSLLFYLRLSQEARQELRKMFYLAAIFSFCGISWYVFFPSHSIAHAFVNFLARHLVPAAAVVFTAVAYVIYSFIKENNRGNILGKAPFALIIIIIALTGILQSGLPVTAENVAREKAFIDFKHCLLKLRGLSKEKDEIGVNYYRNPFIRYYTHRYTVPVFDKATLEKMPLMPRYFIYIPYSDERSGELLKFIQEKYVPVFQCESTRFPTIFCELKK